VDNSKGGVPFIEATGHRSTQLYGSLVWDPYQSGGLGTPEHQRTTAGDVHRANRDILYIDEIKNLQPFDAITLLTVLEEGELPITLRGKWEGGGTSAMAVATEPVPALIFFIAAGNFDSIGMIHPALMDRIVGYGSVVRFNNDMENTVENRRKYVQFIAQETKRFRYIPWSREACEEVLREGQRRSGWSDRLSTKFRGLVDVVLKASQLALRDYQLTLSPSENPIVRTQHVKLALDEYCKSIQKQLLDDMMERRGRLLEITPEGEKVGEIYGLAVVVAGRSGDMAGVVSRLKGTTKKASEVGKKLKGYYKVTGIAKEPQWMDDSVEKVRTVILKRYNIDIEQQLMTHIDFSQAHGVDGPSAGITMTLLMCSLLDKKPLRQDVAVTGEIQIDEGDEIEVTAVGGLHEKITAAQTWKFAKVCIPMKNYKYSINPEDYTIEVVGCETLDDYLREITVGA